MGRSEMAALGRISTLPVPCQSHSTGLDDVGREVLELVETMDLWQPDL